MEKRFTIYLITNLLNEKYYVGWTSKSIKERWEYHCFCAENGSTWHISNAIRKYNESSFSQQALAETDSVEKAKELEKLWILALQSYIPEIGYNMTMGGDGPGWQLLEGQEKEEFEKRRLAGIARSLLAPSQKMLDRGKKISQTHKERGIKPLQGIKKGVTHKEFYGEEKAEEIARKLAAAVKGTKRGAWITNGTSNRLLKYSRLPEGWYYGKVSKKYTARGPDSEETKLSKSIAQRKRWAEQKQKSFLSLSWNEKYLIRKKGNPCPSSSSVNSLPN